MPVAMTQRVYPPPAGRAVEAPWGTGVSDQVVQNFASPTARDAAATGWTSPPVGAVAATVSDKSLWYFAGGAVPAAWKKIAQVDVDVTPVTNLMMPKAGGTFTGDVVFNSAANIIHNAITYHRLAGDAPHFWFQEIGGTGMAYIQTDKANKRVLINAWANGLGIQLATESGVRMHIQNDGNVSMSGILYPAGGVRGGQLIGGTGGGAQLVLSDVGGDYNCYMAFYGSSSSVNSLGNRTGYIGYSGGGTMLITNEFATTGHIRYQANGVHYFLCGATEQARVINGNFLVGKDSNAIGVEGHALFTNGAYYMTRTGDNATGNMYLNRLGSKAGEIFIAFRRDNVPLGNITQLGTTDVTYGHGSDYRMKDIIGPVPDPVARLKRLRPVRVRFHGDDVRGEVDSMIAHEVAEVIPDAVSGVRDGPEMQNVDYGKPVPLVIAALLEVIERLEHLEANTGTAKTKTTTKERPAA